MEPRIKDTVPEGAKVHKKWEYTQENVGGSPNVLNQFGEQGWEVVNIERGWVLFKREKLDVQEQKEEVNDGNI
jgi:hypothetical protein